MFVDAVLWDFDGTLVNSAPKNIAITKEILEVIVPHLSGDNLPRWLHSQHDYHVANHLAANWRELYIDYYGLTAEETDAVVQAAADALPGWSETPIVERARVMFRFRALLEEHFEELAALLTREHGKTLAESRAEMNRGVEIEVVQDDSCVKMMKSFIADRPELWNEDIGV